MKTEEGVNRVSSAGVSREAVLGTGQGADLQSRRVAGTDDNLILGKHELT